MALRGMLLCWAVSSWAKVIPPSALISSSPSVPSVAVPDRITPIARCPLVLRQGAEEEIDRPVLAAGFLPGQQLQDPLRDDHVAVGRDDVDVVRLHPRLVLDLGDRHRGRPRQDLRQQAVVRRGQVLHQHEGHAGVDRQRAEQLREGLQPAGRGADADDRERGAGSGAAAASARASATADGAGSVLGGGAAGGFRLRTAIRSYATPFRCRTIFQFRFHTCVQRGGGKPSDQARTTEFRHGGCTAVPYEPDQFP